MRDSILKKKRQLQTKRKLRVRGKIYGVGERPRISVFRSNKYFYAQAIDDERGITLASVDGRVLKLGKNKESVREIAKIFAENLKSSQLTRAVFDRNGYLYHGVVASFADALRENGIEL